MGYDWQNRTFIELSDILSHRFDCPACGCAVAIPIGEFNHVRENAPTAVEEIGRK